MDDDKRFPPDVACLRRRLPIVRGTEPAALIARKAFRMRVDGRRNYGSVKRFGAVVFQWRYVNFKHDFALIELHKSFTRMKSNLSLNFSQSHKSESNEKKRARCSFLLRTS